MLRLTALMVALLIPAAAAAQTEPGPPGPFVVDVRGAMVGLPNAGEFYPALAPSSTIPGRAFGGELGAHLLFKKLGASRLGVGVSGMWTRGSTGESHVSAVMSAVVPQFSLNFGTADGWSYLSAGYGPSRLVTRVPEIVAPAPEPDSDESDEQTDEAESSDPAPELPTVKRVDVGAMNFGGGARWFVNPHLAVGFDVRFYRLGASREEGTPATTRVALSVGISLR